jgi:O-antigen ligase
MSVAQMVMQETGKKSGWQGAHNSYLQISAENGIPAFLCYLASLLACCSMNFRIFMRCRREAALAGYMPQSLALILMTIAFAVGIVFSNNAYSPALCVLVGMSSANYLAIQRERSAPLQQFSVTALPDSRRPQPVTARTLKAPLIR